MGGEVLLGDTGLLRVYIFACDLRRRVSLADWQNCIRALYVTASAMNSSRIYRNGLFLVGLSVFTLGMYDSAFC